MRLGDDGGVPLGIRERDAPIQESPPSLQIISAPPRDPQAQQRTRAPERRRRSLRLDAPELQSGALAAREAVRRGVVRAISLHKFQDGPRARHRRQRRALVITAKCR